MVLAQVLGGSGPGFEQFYLNYCPVLVQMLSASIQVLTVSGPGAEWMWSSGSDCGSGALIQPP